ncbi:MAG: hypothetical protein U0984_00010 [Prosthecobacter sp.]|nr:hypothetical protein [Prosthecobacter sp.]
MALGLIMVAATLANAQDLEEKRLESLLLLPEPRALRSELSVVPAGAVETVLSPAREIAAIPGIETYSKDEFKRLGLSVQTFTARAKTAADKLLASLKPDLVRDAEGKMLYAVYRGERPVMASLLLAPSLPKLFEKDFGKEIWVALPDRHSLFIFPAKPEALQDFTADLAERFWADVHAASAEIFAIKSGEEPRVVGSFGG